jgi:hypothetical protein
MKKIILSLAIILMSTLSYTTETEKKAPEQNKGAYGGTAYYEFTNFDLGFGFGCTYDIEVTVTITNPFGERTRYFSTTMSPGDTWEFSVSYSTNESITAEIVTLEGNGFSFSHTFNANQPQWWGGESCNAITNNWGTRWTPQGGKTYEFGEDLIQND